MVFRIGPEPTTIPFFDWIPLGITQTFAPFGEGSGKEA